MPAPGLSTGMQLATAQRMVLQPRLLQSIELLQLPSQDLEAWLLDAAAGNEALCVDAQYGDEGRDFVPSPSRVASQAAGERHDALLANAPARQASLSQLVEEQLALVELDPEVADWVRWLIGRLDAAGFLSESDEELLSAALEHGLAGGALLLGQAIAALQGLEPRGIGARDAIEALLLQLDSGDQDYGLLCRLLEDFVGDLARNRLPKVAGQLGIHLDELRRLIGLLGQLDPRPLGAMMGHTAPAIQPDVVVGDASPGFQVRLVRGALPAVTVDPEVSALARDAALPAEVRQHLRGRMEEARAVVAAVQQRGVTLLRVAGSVFAKQHRFLAEGPSGLAPLSMTAVAEELQLALSTVSRAVHGKYVETPWGTFALRHFFQSEAGGVAHDRARKVLASLIDGEDPAQPLADDELVCALASKGIQVARRTVAKYRKELGIASSYRRRAY